MTPAILREFDHLVTKPRAKSANVSESEKNCRNIFEEMIENTLNVLELCRLCRVSARDCQRLRRDAYCMILYVLSVQTEDGGR